jgi:NlpC/P60 family putative phage cell wall peptidase
MTPADIIAAARACLGTPFRHQGRLPGIGLDCAGVAVEVARALGCAPLDVSGYGRTPAAGQLEAVLDAQPDLERVDREDRQPGDILLMRFTGEPQHLAILTDEGTMIHSYEAVGTCCEHRLSAVWAARVVRVYRFRGVVAP